MIRPASPYAWRHSAAGSTSWRMRRRSRKTVVSLSPLSLDGTARSSPSSMTTSRVASPLTANQSRWATSSVLRALAMLKCSSVGRPDMSAGFANVSPRAPEIGQRSQTRPPPLTGRSAEYFDADTGNGVTLFSSPSNSTMTVVPSTGPSGTSTGSRPPAAGRPSGSSAKGEGVAEERGTRYGRQPSGKERSPVWTSYTGSKPRQDRNAR